METLEVRTPITPKTANNRAAATNGSLSALPGVDGRTAQARRFRDLVEQFERELANGETLSIELQAGALIRQAALVVVQMEAMQLAAARGEDVDTDALVRLSNTATRLFAAIAKQRGKKPKAVPSIAEHFARKRAQA